MLYIGPRLHAKSTEFGAFSPFSSETEKNAGESMLMMWLLARPRPDKGPSMEDVLKNFGIFYPPPCLHFDQTFSTKFTQPSLPCLLSG